jgi:hypothetical protein
MRSQKLAAGLTVINFVFLVALLLGAAPTNPTDQVAPSVVRAQAIEVVDADGNVRVQLRLAEDGGGLLRMRDGKGEVRVKVQAKDDGAGLLFLDQQTEPAVQLGSGKDGTSLKLTGADKKQRVITP